MDVFATMAAENGMEIVIACELATNCRCAPATKRHAVPLPMEQERFSQPQAPIVISRPMSGAYRFLRDPREREEIIRTRVKRSLYASSNQGEDQKPNSFHSIVRGVGKPEKQTPNIEKPKYSKDSYEKQQC